MATEGAKQTPADVGPSGTVGPRDVDPGTANVLGKLQHMMEERHKYKGTWFSKLLAPRMCLEAMETFQVRDDDIFIITFPKCGTHWTMEIVYLILADGYLDKIERDEKMKFGTLEMFIRAPNNPQPAYEFVETVTSRRVLPTHLPINILPPAVIHGKAKVIFVARNPKDGLTSLFGFLSTQLGMNNMWNEIFEQYLSTDMLNGNFFDFTLAYWNHRHDDNFLFLKYEDMKRDPRSAVIMIADHIGCVLSDEAIDRVVANSSMDTMKKSYQKADAQGVMPTFEGQDKEILSKFLRKGTVGDWKNYFTVAQSEKFDEYCREKLAGSGLTLQFE